MRSCFVHHGPIRRALHRMKFHGRYRIAQALASQMAEGWARFGVEADLLIPVPTSKARQQQRGYNQAAMLAHALAERLAIPFHAYALRRARATRSQEGLARSARRENVRGAFLGDPAGYQGKRVVAVDDVCTSIVPLEACATALYQAGAASGWGFTLARAIMSKAPHE
ncbi:ComF family protein [Thermoflexus sp.]|uniref:ComF family protein n=1 Tax=Thermoflexus sp. TaxID=1969742 RepID=UPI0035E44FDA